MIYKEFLDEYVKEDNSQHHEERLERDQISDLYRCHYQENAAFIWWLSVPVSRPAPGRFPISFYWTFKTDPIGKFLTPPILNNCESRYQLQDSNFLFLGTEK